MNTTIKRIALFIVFTLLLTMSAACSSSGSTNATTAAATTAAKTSVATTTAGSSGSSSTAKFDNYARPVVKSGGKLTVAYVHTKPEVESQTRSIHQTQIEAAHRGWTLVDVVYENDQQSRDSILNVINQKVDAIILGSTESMAAKQDLIDMARKAGIGVYNNDNTMIPGIIANSTMPNGKAAMELIYKIGEEHYWKDNIAILTAAPIQVHVERTNPIGALIGVYPSMKLLADQDVTTYAGGPAQAGFDFTKTWLQKYGNQMTGIIASCDFLGMPAAEAIKQSGDTTGEKMWVAGIDGGSQAWTYIRNKTPFKYSYAQPFELYTHKIFEVIDQVQVKGIAPGDKASLIKFSGATIYSDGYVVTRENVPTVGSNIHSVFNYYGGDANDKSAWYNWTEAGGATIISAGSN